MGNNTKDRQRLRGKPVGQQNKIQLHFVPVIFIYLADLRLTELGILSCCPRHTVRESFSFLFTNGRGVVDLDTT